MRYAGLCRSTAGIWPLEYGGFAGLCANICGSGTHRYRDHWKNLVKRRSVNNMNGEIEAAPAPVSWQDGPRTIRYCKTCQRGTAHQIVGCGGVQAALCIPCQVRLTAYELDRD